MVLKREWQWKTHQDQIPKVTKIIPAEKSGEYFGILDICGKGASFLGTTLIGVISQMTGSVNKGISVLIIIFIIGIVLFRKSVAMLPKAK